MKSKILIVALFIFGLVSNSFAQQPEPGKTKSVPWDHLYYFYEDIYCDGVWVDFVIGPMWWNNISHFVDGVAVWEISRAKGMVTNLKGESFRLNCSMVKQSIPIDGKILWHTHLLGNKGSAYMLFFSSNTDWSDITLLKAVCTEGKNE